MSATPRVTVIIPNYNGRRFMDQCMEALRRQTYTDFVVLIVDNGSTDGSVEYLQELEQRGLRLTDSTCKADTPSGVPDLPGFPDTPDAPARCACGSPAAPAAPAAPEVSAAPVIPVRCICLKENTGFSGAVNAGITAADTEYIVLLNNDTETEPDYLKAMTAEMDRDKRARVFAVSPRMIQLYHPELLDDAGDGYCLLGWAFQRGVGQPVQTGKFQKRTEVFSACAGAAMYRRAVLEELRLDKNTGVPADKTKDQSRLPDAIRYESLAGTEIPAAPYFDPLHFAYLEDLDISWRARIHGYRILYAPGSVVRHVGSGTSGSRYNSFKVRLAARNNVYLNYKNMPFLQWLIHMPGILTGVLVKWGFFCKLGFGKDYAGGFLEGLRTLDKVRPHRTAYRRDRFWNYLRIEWLLLLDTFSYVEDFAVRQNRKRKKI